MRQPGGDHAIVIGGSIAGLAAARALQETFTRVTVLDRDILPGVPEPRRGVPQGRQAHALQARGANALEELFPGLREDMIAAGAVSGDVHWYLSGYLLSPRAPAPPNIALSRPLTEHLIRSRVAALPGVRIIDSVSVTGLRASRGRVTGISVRGTHGGAVESMLGADVVVDAGGRGSRADDWLSELGFPPPLSVEVRPDTVYVSRHYRREHHHLDGRLGTVVAPFPGLPRGGAVLGQEADRFVVLLAGLLGEDPPVSEAGMLAFADSLPVGDIAGIIRSATPLDSPAKMRHPASVRRYHQQLHSHLRGFLVTGDALCSFNPVYGQGITVAALEALALRKVLAEGGTHRLPERFYVAVRKSLDSAWLMSAGSDLRFPQVSGKRRPGDSLRYRYLERYHAAASVDPALATAFLRVSHMIDPPGRLVAPSRALRVLRSAKRAVPAQTPAVPDDRS